MDAANNAVNALPEDMQSVINEVIDAAVKAVEQASSDIDAALQTWDSLSDSAKQAIVDEANSSGAMGCGSGYTCTMEDAENLADSLRGPILIAVLPGCRRCHPHIAQNGL